jgi:hypothetical protein
MLTLVYLVSPGQGVLGYVDGSMACPPSSIHSYHGSLPSLGLCGLAYLYKSLIKDDIVIVFIPLSML